MSLVRQSFERESHTHTHTNIVQVDLGGLVFQPTDRVRACEVKFKKKKTIYTRVRDV